MPDGFITRSDLSGVIFNFEHLQMDVNLLDRYGTNWAPLHASQEAENRFPSPQNTTPERCSDGEYQMLAALMFSESSETKKEPKRGEIMDIWVTFKYGESFSPKQCFESLEVLASRLRVDMPDQICLFADKKFTGISFFPGDEDRLLDILQNGWDILNR